MATCVNIWKSGNNNLQNSSASVTANEPIGGVSIGLGTKDCLHYPTSCVRGIAAGGLGSGSNMPLPGPAEPQQTDVVNTSRSNIKGNFVDEDQLAEQLEMGNNNLQNSSASVTDRPNTPIGGVADGLGPSPAYCLYHPAACPGGTGIAVGGLGLGGSWTNSAGWLQNAPASLLLTPGPAGRAVENKGISGI